MLNVWEEEDVAAHIARVGRQMMDALPPGPWDLVGLPEMWLLRFHDAALERDVLLGCAERGVLLKRGAYNFPSLAHGEQEVRLTQQVMEEALGAL